MILEETNSFVSNFALLPQQGNLLRFQWVNTAPEDGKILGFLAVYQKANGDTTAEFTKYLQGMTSEALKDCLKAGKWIPNLQYVKAIPAGNNVFSVDAHQYSTPCQIALWTVTEEDGELHLYYKNAPSLIRPLKLKYTLKQRTFQEAQYGRFFHRVRKPEEKGVELRIWTDEENADYEDGAVGYRLRRDSDELVYPIPREALGKKLQFVSSQSQAYHVGDFLVKEDKAYAGYYQLEVGR